MRKVILAVRLGGGGRAVEARVRAMWPQAALLDVRGLEAVPAALERARAMGPAALRVLPLLLLRGDAFHRLEALVALAGAPVAAPLLETEADWRAVLAAVAQSVPTAPDEALVAVGHGFSGCAAFHRAGRPDLCFVGALRGGPDPEALAPAIRAAGFRRVALAPLMLAAGVHARRDLDGLGADSWRVRFARAGLPARAVLRGLEECPAVQDRFVARLRAILEEEDGPWS